jgi:amino acid adenylation domain-containing protein
VKHLHTTITDTAAAAHHSKSYNYRTKKLSGDLIKSSFPYDYPRAHFKEKEIHNKGERKRMEFALSGELSQRLIYMSNNSDLRLFMILAAGVMALLYQYTNNREIIVGAPRLKQDSGIKPVKMNQILILRNQITGTMTGKELLLQVKKTISEAIEHVNYNFDRLMHQLDLSYSYSRTHSLLSPFDTAVLLENIQDRSDLNHIKLNMIFSTLKKNDGITGQVEYNSLLYNKTTIERIVTHFINFLQEAFFKVDSRLNDIDILSEAEKRLLLVDFNNTNCHYPQDMTIHDAFARQAEKKPAAIAVQGKSLQLSYQQLNEAANQWAHRLKSRGIKSDTVVGVMLERSVELIVVMVGILKAGAAYLPIDINNPGKRVQYLLKDSGINILITKQALKKEYSLVETICPQDEKTRQWSKDNPVGKTGSQRLLYVIYTSGSTGKPKGVLINHRGFMNLVYSHHLEFGQESRVRMSQVASPGFDGMAWEVWPCLLGGAALHIVPEEIRSDPASIKQWLMENKITLSYQPTAIAEQLLQKEWSMRGVALKVLVTAGDRLTQYPSRSYPFRFYNLYGPTEGTVTSTRIQLTPAMKNHNFPPIGKPIHNRSIYILGPNLKLKPIGAVGELCISGAGIALGYLNNPPLTEKKFIPHPFESGRSKILYRTGDLARWLWDGNIEFHGRLDQQVKIRGLRIEMGEIEKQLLGYEPIRDAVVTFQGQDEDNRRLIAYVVPDSQLAFSVQQLRMHRHKNRSDKKDVAANTNGKWSTPEGLLKSIKGFLKELLPDYMVPSEFVFLEQFPITSHGKVDRKSLPQVKGIRPRASATYVAPKTPLQETIANIWKWVLKLDKVGINDNFFDIGGHSLTIIKVNSRLRNQLGKDIPIVTMFNYPTIGSLAAHLDREGNDFTDTDTDVDADTNVNVAAERLAALDKGKERLKRRIQKGIH